LKTGTLAPLVRANLGFFLSRKTRGASSHLPRPPVSLPPDFFGVCVASSEDPACDDYVVARLKDLGLRCVRVDYGSNAAGTFADRFVNRLVQEGFQVGLHLVATRQEMEALPRPEGAERWRQFLQDTFARFGGQVEFFEIGSTVNRRRWSGFTLPLFLQAWDIAWEESMKQASSLFTPARQDACATTVLAGPNSTDFEPFYNTAFLDEMRRRGRLPAIHTNNLFVERATEPEAFDHKILGHTFAPGLKFNTLKKASLLGAIGRWAGAKRNYSTHVSWSLRRIRRVLEDAEEQQADYVTRYCCLMAASGGFDRVYWGPLVGQREGLINDGTNFFPEMFHVTFYGQANGEVANYRMRPAFEAFRAVNEFLAGTTFTRRLETTGALEIYEFQSGTHTTHVVWCRNAACAAAAACYGREALDSVEVYDRDGWKLAQAPKLFTQSPTYLRWPIGTEVQLLSGAGDLPHVRLSSTRAVDYAPVKHAEWRGLVIVRMGKTPVDAAALLPGRFAPMDATGVSVLRNKRNRVWAVPAPWDASQKIVVKHFRPARGLRGWLQRFKPNKALRSWNGAHELLRRGIPTPRPIAWLEHPHAPSESESYYLCEVFEGGSSARHAFYAFNRGEPEFLGIPRAELYSAIAALLLKMHGRGVFFRDLSAGNLLLRRSDHPLPHRGSGQGEGATSDTLVHGEGDKCPQIDFALIDTARARIGVKSLSVRKRLADLMRLCHPLAWDGREQLLQAYFTKANVHFVPWMRLAFHYYDWKHRIKKLFRRRQMKRSGDAPSP